MLTVIPERELELSKNPAAVYIASLSPGSRPAMLGALDTIAEMLTGQVRSQPGALAMSIDWGALRFSHTAAIRAQLQERYKPAMANKLLVALRQVLKCAWRLELMSADDYSRARDIGSIKNYTLPAGRALSAGEVKALMEACAADSSAAGARDAAMIALLYAAGLRRAEICTLELADYNTESGRLVIRGKGGKERTAYLNDGSAAALADWLAVRGAEPGRIFCPINKGGKIDVRKMHPEAVFFLLAKRGAEAGIENLSPHDLRRTFASELLDRGADISTVSKLMGHASVTTTARYDRRGEEVKRQAAGLLHVPYHKRK